MSKKVIILGGTGMLGQQVVRTFIAEEEPVVYYSRSGKHEKSFVYSGQPAEVLTQQLSISAGDYIINCIGWIPQVASGDAALDASRANLLNTELPERLEEISTQLGAKVIQVATDCVFSGRTGGYSEDSVRDATDVYGETKIRGENAQPSAMRIRASIVGPDAKSSAGLFSWFLSQRGKEAVTGYTNHIWNGVSTLAMSKLFLGIVRNEAFESGCFHWLPSGQLTKYELLGQFSRSLELQFPKVVPGLGQVSVDRSLKTTSPMKNKELWGLAGYREVPEIEFVTSEFINNYLQNWNNLRCS